MLVKAWGYYLGGSPCYVSQRGVVTGASYTDVNAQLPALRLLLFIAIVCAVLFLVNIRLRGWALPVIARRAPRAASRSSPAACVSRLRAAVPVAPQELQKERPYIERNIEATRTRVRARRDRHDGRATVTPTSTRQDVTRTTATISNIRVWRPDILLNNFEALQRILQFYEFADVDVDRYDLDGARRVLMVSAREMNQDGIPGGGGTWQNRHLVYTHGFGAVASQVNTATTEGQPVFTLQDIPPVGQPSLSDNGSRVYFGESSSVPFVVVNTGAEELDYQGTATNDQAQVTSYVSGARAASRWGVPPTGAVRMAVQDVNLLISGLSTRTAGS